MSRAGLEAKKRRKLVRQGKAAPIPIRTNVWQALKAAGLANNK